MDVNPMKYILFVGSRLGFEALNILIEKSCDIQYVFIEKEHSHEFEKYYQKIIKKCKDNSLDYSVDSTKNEILSILNEKLMHVTSIDYIMSFGYRRMIPENITKMAKIASLGTHFSPLPRYRGFAPLNWLLINGEEETAVNLFYLDKEVDNGDIIERETVEINYEDDINTLYEKCLNSFRVVLERALPKLENGKFEAIKQNSEYATYTCARNPEDGLIDWNWDSFRIYNFSRALTYPFPGAFTYMDGRKLYVWSCQEYKIPKYEGRIPGKVIKVLKNQGVVVLCGDGAVLIKEVQLENENKVTADKIINSVRLTLGK